MNIDVIFANATDKELCNALTDTILSDDNARIGSLVETWEDSIELLFPAVVWYAVGYFETNGFNNFWSPVFPRNEFVAGLRTFSAPLLASCVQDLIEFVPERVRSNQEDAYDYCADKKVWLEIADLADDKLALCRARLLNSIASFIRHNRFRYERFIKSISDSIDSTREVLAMHDKEMRGRNKRKG
jgi:hypothetical protein